MDIARDLNAQGMSPSSRRAWIEINVRIISADYDGVALLAEGVDRNFYFGNSFSHFDLSPSSRRAWIEIHNQRDVSIEQQVALLAEGVDRNTSTGRTRYLSMCRPPRGGRG